jgi:benzoate-CoA ligase family protein
MVTYDDLPRQFNLTTYFLDSNLEVGRGDTPALIDGDATYSYRQVSQMTNAIGNGLLTLGVEMEDRVLLALNDSVEFVAAWYAVVKIGAVVAEIYPFLQAHDYLYYLNYSRAKVILVDRENLQKVREIAGQCPHLRAILVAGEDDDWGNNEYSLSRLIAEAPTDLAAADTTKDDIALWKFTTGSTGKPKAAVHCQHDPVISFVGYAQGVLKMDQTDRVLAVPKLFFGYARDLVTLFAFGAGACGIIFPDRSAPERILSLVQKHKPTILVNVPTMMNAMISHPEASSYDVSSLRLNTSAGEALPPAIHQGWLDTFGVETINGIGSSEAYHIYISVRPDSGGRPGSLGQLVPGYTAQIVDQHGQPAADGEVGELWITGESTALMYWNEHEKSKKTFFGDTIHTGDLFRRDSDGYYWFEGRVDDLLKVGGMWVSPLEIESSLLEHDAVQECAVVGIEVDGLTQPCAYIVLAAGQSGGAELIETLQMHVRTRLAPHKYPRQVRFVESLPKTSSGKIDRGALTRTSEAG